MSSKKKSVKDFHLRVLQHLDNDIESLIDVFRAIYEAATEMDMTDIETLDGELIETLLDKDNKNSEAHKRVLGMKIKFLRLQDIESLIDLLSEELGSVEEIGGSSSFSGSRDGDEAADDITGENPAIAINGSRKIH
ncbi:MAG: hypothetical protein D6711_03290 [Chloroflexi bacterium]|nr:MAG: hypothetical protein D6711_03290 [Chloroflexota bacterium]